VLEVTLFFVIFHLAQASIDHESEASTLPCQIDVARSGRLVGGMLNFQLVLVLAASQELFQLQVSTGGCATGEITLQ